MNFFFKESPSKIFRGKNIFLTKKIGNNNFDKFENQKRQVFYKKLLFVKIFMEFSIKLGLFSRKINKIKIFFDK